MNSPRKRKQLYEGKAKVIYEGPEPRTVIQYFKDDATAFNNVKKGTIAGKGVINNRISAYIMENLQRVGIATHYIKTLNMREQLVKKVEILPVEVIVRNVAAGSSCKRLGLTEGEQFEQPLIEYCYKNDELGDPLVSEEHLVHFEWVELFELDEIRSTALRINDFISGLFIAIGLQLVDFKLEFGRHVENNIYSIVLADEISPDSCRLWDIKTSEKMDKDRFRRDLGGVEEAYKEVARRLGVLDKNISTEDKNNDDAVESNTNNN
ncbi:MAG: phosphoribosylaminoimidazolesuccinocarboxamide synthase [Rickettsiales bacterium]|nr:phosphoribosylaminoimidazolesuccinocarboxamide synthase [Rickettsiales bacterium]